MTTLTRHACINNNASLRSQDCTEMGTPDLAEGGGGKQVHTSTAQVTGGRGAGNTCTHIQHDIVGTYNIIIYIHVYTV